MRGQIGLAETVRRLGGTARQAEWSRSAAARPAGPAAGVRPADWSRRSRPKPAKATASAGPTPAGRGCRPMRRSAADPRPRSTSRRRAVPPSRFTVSRPPRVRSHSAWKLLLSSALKGSDAVVQRQGRFGAAAGDVHRQMRSGGNRDAAALGLQKDRRDARIGRRRDPGLKFGRRRTRRDRQRRRHRRIQPGRRVGVGDRQTGHDGQQQRIAQGARVTACQSRPRQANLQPADLGDRAGRMRLPQRETDGCPRSPVCRSAPIAADGPDRSEFPAAGRRHGRPATGFRGCREPADQLPRADPARAARLAAKPAATAANSAGRGREKRR